MFDIYKKSIPKPFPYWLKQSDFYAAQLNWSIIEESFGHFRIDVESLVLDAGEYGATYVNAIPSFQTCPYRYLLGVTPKISQSVTIW